MTTKALHQCHAQVHSVSGMSSLKLLAIFQLNHTDHVFSTQAERVDYCNKNRMPSPVHLEILVQSHNQ